MIYLAGLLIYSGAAFFIAGSLGLLRLPNFASRLHALTKADNLGLGLVCAGLILLQDDWFKSLQLGVIWLLVLAGSAVSSYLLVRHHQQGAQR